MRDLHELGQNLLSIGEQKRALDYQAEKIKDEIAYTLEQEGTGELVLPTDEGENELVYKMNVRFGVKFDKDGLAARIGRPRDELDYHGISNLVEQGYLKANLVSEFQEETKSQFVSVRRRKALGGKK